MSRLGKGALPRTTMRVLLASVALVLVTGFCRAALAQDPGESGDSRSLLEMPRARQGYCNTNQHYSPPSFLLHQFRGSDKDRDASQDGERSLEAEILFIPDGGVGRFPD